MSKVFATFGARFARLLLCTTGLALMSWCQAPLMRTRYLTSLTRPEIEDYLKRNDVIFIPVGNVEAHGGLPADCEYVGPLAFGQKMGEEVMPEHPSDPSLNKLQALGPGSGAIGTYLGDPGEHGGLAKPITVEQRAQLAKEEVAMIDATLIVANVKGIVQAM